MQNRSQAAQRVSPDDFDDDGDWGEFACAPGVQPIAAQQTPMLQSHSSLGFSTPQLKSDSEHPSQAKEEPSQNTPQLPSALTSTHIGLQSQPNSNHSPATPLLSQILPLPAQLSPALPVGQRPGEPNVPYALTDVGNGAYASFHSTSNGHNSDESPAITPAEYAAAAASSDSSPATSALIPTSNHQSGGALVGFDTLNPVQSYAVGALAVVLLREYSTDMNGLAFARAHVANILSALRLSEGQQTALFALSPAKEDRRSVVNQCVELVGDESTRFRAVQAMLALAVARGVYDARSRAFLCSVANSFGVAWRQVAAVELAIAIELYNHAEVEVSNEFLAPAVSNEHQGPKTVGEIMAERRRKKQKMKRVMKVGGITLVGGILFGVTGGIIAPALLSALAGVGVASAAGLAASGSVASGAVVGSLFGVAGAGVTQGKARKRTLNQLEEFDFERPDDPRVVEEKQRRTEREFQKQGKHQQRLLLKAHGETSEQLVDVAPVTSADSEVHLNEVEYDSAHAPARDILQGTLFEQNIAKSADYVVTDEEQSPSNEQKGKKHKKQPKVIVGSKGLEAAGLIPSLHICICVPAWLNERRYGSSLRQFEEALKDELPCSQHIALRWESRRLFEMGLAFAKFWASKATVTTVQNAYPHAVAAASSVAGAVAFAFALPLTVLSCLDYIDNPWSVLVSLSNTAGEDLADVLVGRSYGQRPVTLFGYSIGARVIFKCLESLASRGALGIVDNVFLMSAPVSADPKRWEKIRPVVAGRIVNAYGTMDWALAFFHRGCGHGVYVSGLRAVELDGIENLNMSYIGLEGHKELKDVIPRAMRAMGVGKGYISLPPAKVITRSVFAIGSAHSLGDSGNRIPSEKDDVDIRNQLQHPIGDSENILNPRLETEDDSFWQSTGVRIEDMPSRKALEKAEELGKGTMNNETKDVDKKKGKSWYKLSSWSIKKPGKGKLSPEQDLSAVKNEELDSSTETSMKNLRLENSDEADTLRNNSRMSRDSLPSATDSVRSVTKPSPESKTDNLPNEYSEVVELETRLPTRAMWDDDSDDMDARNTHETEWNGTFKNERSGESCQTQNNNAFDWELQRRIWEEQERQLRERGYADDAVDIETGTKVVLGIGIEIAGVRIHPFIGQDYELPVPPVVELFTNCCIDQKGLAIRVFEHEKRRKSLPLNPFRQERKYPKLLGEVELSWSVRRPRAESRFSVSIEANSDGDIIVKVSERYRDGTTGKEETLLVPRSKLCTMRERLEMEAKEKEKSLLMLPAPESTPRLRIDNRP